MTETTGIRTTGTGVRRPWLTAAALCLLLVVGLVGCGGRSERAATTPSSTVGTSAGAATAASETGASATGNCQKARFALHAGLAAGAVHRWLWKPYQAGTFAQGASGRKTALVKGALAGAFAVHELRVARDNIRGCPGSQALVSTLQSGLGKVGALAAAVKGGSLSAGDLTGADGALSSIKEQAKDKGIDVKEQEPTERQLLSGGSAT